jgi:acyl carrier protein
LVAYVVPREAPSDPEQLSEALHEELNDAMPAYMVPDTIMVLESLPRTSGGKVNRGLLPKPESFGTETEEYVAPESPTEQIIAEIWRDILDAEQVGIYSDFFALGGHSLSATQVIGRVNSRFGVDLAVRQLFDDPTVDGLALAVEEYLLAEIGAGE